MKSRGGRHGLSIEDRDRLAKQRGLYSLATLPNCDGYQFDGFAADGWRYSCHIYKDSREIHRIGGESFYDELIGWKPKEAK